MSFALCAGHETIISWLRDTTAVLPPLSCCICALGVAKVWVTSPLTRSFVAQVLVVGALTVLRVELQDGGHLGNDIKSSLSAECNWPQHAENGL